MEVGEVIFEKAKLVDHAPSKMYPQSTNFFFQLEEAITTDKGTTDRVGVSAGQITKAMNKLSEDWDTLIGREFRLVFEGTNVMSNGPFKGKDAKAFTLQVYDKDDIEEITEEKSVDAKKVLAAQKKVEAESGDNLDDMMN